MSAGNKGDRDHSSSLEVTANCEQVKGHGAGKEHRGDVNADSHVERGGKGDSEVSRTDGVENETCYDTSDKYGNGNYGHQERSEPSARSEVRTSGGGGGNEEIKSDIPNLAANTTCINTTDVLSTSMQSKMQIAEDEDADFVDAQDSFEEDDTDGWQDASDVVVSDSAQYTKVSTTESSQTQSQESETRTTPVVDDETKQNQSENTGVNEGKTSSNSSGDGQTDGDAFIAEALDGEEEKRDEKKSIEIDETVRLEMEAAMTEEEKQAKRDEAQEHKKSGNDLFKNGEYLDAVAAYTEALELCPLAFKKDRSVMYANRGACCVRLEHHDDAVEDCTKALELNPVYLKVYLRRAQVYELTEKLDEALGDFQKALELDPGNYEARAACLRLPDQIKERNEKLKEEMMGKLKDLGNLVLRPFGLSTDNFQLQQDPNSGGYSVNFNQNPTNGK